jgi:hypothetical protein
MDRDSVVTACLVLNRRKPYLSGKFVRAGSLIKIRYSSLPTGLHVRAEARGRHTFIYLLPGLTPAQRRAAMHRVRSSARMGLGPKVSAAGFTRAMAADSVRTTIRNGGAAMRMHPALLLLPVVLLVSTVVAYALMVTVSVRIQPDTAGPGAVPVAPAQGAGTTGASRTAGSPPGGAAVSAGARRPGLSRPGRQAPSRSRGQAADLVPGASGRSSSALPSPSGSGSSSPAPAQPRPAPSHSAAPPRSPSPVPTPLPCEHGPLGVCLYQ